MNRKSQLYIVLILSFSLFLMACSAEVKELDTNKEGNIEEVIERIEVATNISDTIRKEGIQLVATASQDLYNYYQLKLLSTLEENLEEGEYQLKFQLFDDKGKKVKNNKLKVGLMVNNEFHSEKPLSDLTFEIELMQGNNVVFAYLINDRGTSVKSSTTALLKNFYVGSAKSYFNANQPHFFYIQPIDNSLLDFYLFNTNLNEKGNRLRLMIDDEVFILNYWQDYSIEGLSVGEHHLRLQLIDEDDEVILGPFNDSGLRTITIR